VKPSCIRMPHSLAALLLVLFYVPTIAAFSSPAGSLTINKYPGNNACFKFIYNGLTVVADPFGMNERISPAAVTISHNDADHTDLSQVFGTYRLMRTEESFECGDVSIVGIAGHHYKRDVGKSNIVYLFKFGGIRLAHFASQGEVPTEQMYDKLGTVDILLIQCMAIERKLDPYQVVEIAKKVNARIVIPEHGTPGYIEPQFRYLLGSVVQFESGQFSITKNQIDEIKTPILAILDTQ
jgi:hypothetical protein